MSRKCFLTDGDSWFAVDVDRRGFFNTTLERCNLTDRSRDWEEFEMEFGFDRLVKGVSDYSFDDLREIYD